MGGWRGAPDPPGGHISGCAAVVCGSSAAVSNYSAQGSVRQCVAVCAAVCGSVTVAVCGSARGSVRQCAAVRVDVCGCV
jgi:hypothetical protein